MSDMWMPAQTTVPPGATARSAAGTSAPAGAKISAASSGSGPLRPERPRQPLGLLVLRAGEGEHAPPLVHRDLADDVRRRAEAVQTEALRVAREPQRAVADQPAAQQRRELERVRLVRQREAEALVGDRPLGVAAVDVAAREASALAEVLAPRAAERALAARPAQPRHPDPRPVPVDPRDDLVAEHERQVAWAQLAVAQVQVGPADPVRLDPQAQLPPPRRRLGHLGRPQRAA